MTSRETPPEGILSPAEELAIRNYLEAKGLPVSEAVTFGDAEAPWSKGEVGAQDEYSSIRSRRDITDFRATLARDLVMNIPLLSANMSTVTGAAMAVAMAREGGLGCVPQTIPLEDRIRLIECVRRTDCALIENPAVISDERTLAEAKAMIAELRRNGVDVNSLVAVDNQGRLSGILSRRDYQDEEDETKWVMDLMAQRPYFIRRREDEPSGEFFERARRLLKERRVEKLPIKNQDGSVGGLFTRRGLLYERDHPRVMRDETGKFMLVASIGVGEFMTPERLREAELQLKAGASAILIDTARAFSVNARDVLDAVRVAFPGVPVVIGNTCSPAGAKFLFEHGADAVKVNQGRGYACRTSDVTPVGVGQLTAIAACSAIAKLYGRRIVADGGMRYPSDMVKAIMAGADTVMTAYLIAGTDESPTPAYPNKDGFLVKEYKGSASYDEQRRRITEGGLDRVRKAEGVRVEVPATGTMEEKVADILGSFASAMSYFGAGSLDELRENARFVLQSAAGAEEGTKRSNGAS